MAGVFDSGEEDPPGATVFNEDISTTRDRLECIIKATPEDDEITLSGCRHYLDALEHTTNQLKEALYAANYYMAEMTPGDHES